jgi:hypothetical protein
MTHCNSSFFLTCLVYLSFLHPSPALHLKTSQVFLMYCLKCQRLSTIQSCAHNVALY